MKFHVRYANHPENFKRCDTQELRKHDPISGLFEANSINLTCSLRDFGNMAGIPTAELL